MYERMGPEERWLAEGAEHEARRVAGKQLAEKLGIRYPHLVFHISSNQLGLGKVNVWGKRDDRSLESLGSASITNDSLLSWYDRLVEQARIMGQYVCSECFCVHSLFVQNMAEFLCKECATKVQKNAYPNYRR